MFKKLLFRFLELSFGFSYPLIACFMPFILLCAYHNVGFLGLYFITIPIMIMQYEAYEQYALDGLWFKIYNAIKDEPW